jgi:hypothetical protein
MAAGHGLEPRPGLPELVEGLGLARHFAAIVTSGIVG